MANGGANISRGMGRGAAQVYDTSGPVNAYARLMYQQQLRRAAETKALTDEFGKLTPEGIRQQDIPIFIEQVGKWKSASIEANNERDPVKKAIKTQEAEQEKLKSYSLKDYSKSEGKKRSDFASSMLIPNNRDNFTDEAIDIFRETDKYSVNDSRYLSDLTTLQQQIDGSTTMAEIAKINKVLLDATQPTRVERKGNIGNNVGTFVTYNKVAIPQNQIDAMGLAFRISPKLRAGLRQMYPEQANLSNDEFIATVIPDYVSKNPAQEPGKEDFKSDKDDRDYQLRLRRENRLAAGDGEGAINENINVTPKTFTGTKLPQKSTVTGNPILDKNKKQVRKGKGITADFVAYSLVNPPSFQMPQLTQAFNIDKAVNEPINTEDAVNLTGIGYVKTKGGGTELKATIKVKGEEHIINLADLPVDIKTDKKYYLPVLRAVENEYKRLQQSKPTTKPASETLSKIDVSKFKYQGMASGAIPIFTNDGKTWVDEFGRKDSPYNKSDKLELNKFKNKVEDLRTKYKY